MERARFNIKIIYAVYLLVGLWVAWTLFAPVSVGGQSIYVIVSGNSMEPTLYGGDLVILRRTDRYEIGDIATYVHPELGPVIHRIIGKANGGYLFQGDNNDWFDAHQPAAEALMGKAWLRLPGPGTIARQLPPPLPRGLVIILVGTTVTGVVAYQFRGRPRQPPLQRGNHRGAILWLAAATFASILVALYAFNRPLTPVAAGYIAYQHQGEFNYRPVESSGSQGRGRLQPGAPVPLQATEALHLDYNYRFITRAESELQGKYRLLVELRRPDGRRRIFELQPAQPFQGQGLTTGTRLELGEIRRLIESQAASSTPFNRLVIRPEIQVDVTIGDRVVRERFAPEVRFRVDGRWLQLISNGEGKIWPVAWRQSGQLLQSDRQPAWSLSPPASLLCLLAAVGGILALGTFGLCHLPIVGRYGDAVRTRGGATEDGTRRI